MFGAFTCYTPAEQNVLPFTAEKSITAPHLVPEAPGIRQFPELNPGFLGSQGFQTIFKDLNESFTSSTLNLSISPLLPMWLQKVVIKACPKQKYQTKRIFDITYKNNWNFCFSYKHTQNQKNYHLGQVEGTGYILRLGSHKFMIHKRDSVAISGHICTKDPPARLILQALPKRKDILSPPFDTAPSTDSSKKKKKTKNPTSWHPAQQPDVLQAFALHLISTEMPFAGRFPCEPSWAKTFLLGRERNLMQ